LIEVSEAEEVLERSKKNPKNTQEARVDKINAKYDAELDALEQSTTPYSRTYCCTNSCRLS
jgi:hypothetical protein